MLVDNNKQQDELHVENTCVLLYSDIILQGLFLCGVSNLLIIWQYLICVYL